MTFFTKNKKWWTLALSALVIGIAVLSPVVAFAQQDPLPPNINPPVDLSKLQIPSIAQPNIQAPPPPSTSAADCGISFDPRKWFGCAMDGMTTIIGFFLKMILIISGWALEIVLAANQNIMNTPAVQTGFNIMLAVANLGFVLGIIIIAIMTILQSQTYGIKQILWKLILMAVLVNFSLPLVSILLGFADQLTVYFMNAIGSVSISDFVTSFGTAFSPQKVAGIIPSQSTIVENPSGWAEVFGQTSAALISLLFLGVTIITMLATVIMFLIRYLTLAVLLILMPIAWLTWVFPAFSGNWSKWWSHFLRWAFFGPILMFFIFLSLFTWTNRANFIDQQIVAKLQNDPSSASQAAQIKPAGSVGKFLPDLTTLIGEQIIVVGLMVAGLFAANSLGIAFAGAAFGAAKGAGKSFGLAVARKGGGLMARAVATGAPPTAYTGWRKVFNPLNRLRSAAGRIPVGRNVATFGQTAAASSGILASMYQGAKNGTGYFKKKRKLTDAERAAGEIDLENSGTERASQASRPPGGSARKPGEPLIVPAPEDTGSGGKRETLVMDTETGEMVTKEERESRQERREDEKRKGTS